MVDVHLYLPVWFPTSPPVSPAPVLDHSLLMAAELDPRTPLSSAQHFIPAGTSNLAIFPRHVPPAQPDDRRSVGGTDDDDFDEDSIPGFTYPQAPTTPLSARPPPPPPLDKGKGRAKDTLLPPPAAGPNGTGTGTGTSSNPLAGNIGTPANGATPKADRRTVGGVRVETRCVATRHGPLAAPGVAIMLI